ncbi:unnamed protein product [Rangifer tarandus platyrhynchus]|uniref:Uncharacterized protein n=2 Tax=Rangifer tarandus platyrhynchus TaxID=3082113 RepID=A0AC59ZTW9_RANTA|nr:unnamed protein product [Rangifer tarandus platyrhynchus]
MSILAGRCLCFAGGQMVLMVPLSPSHRSLVPDTMLGKYVSWGCAPILSRGEVVSQTLPRGGEGASGDRAPLTSIIAPTTPPLGENAGGNQAQTSLLALPPDCCGECGVGRWGTEEPQDRASSGSLFK